MQISSCAAFFAGDIKGRRGEGDEGCGQACLHSTRAGDRTGVGSTIHQNPLTSSKSPTSGPESRKFTMRGFERSRVWGSFCAHRSKRGSVVSEHARSRVSIARRRRINAGPRRFGACREIRGWIPLWHSMSSTHGTQSIDLRARSSTMSWHIWAKHSYVWHIRVISKLSIDFIKNLTSDPMGSVCA